MSESPSKIFSAAIGQAMIRAVYLDGEKAYYAPSPATWPDLGVGLSEVTKKISKQVGQPVVPDKTILTGSPTTLAALPKDLKAELIQESEAIQALEKKLSNNLGAPTAILDLGASTFLDHYPAEEVARWLPYGLNLTDLENYLANRKIFPRSIPTTAREYEIDLAVARQAIIKLGEREGSDFLTLHSRMNLVLTGGIVSEIKNLPDLAILILDAFYFPDGVTTYADRNASLTPLGAVSVAGGEANLTDHLIDIGTFLSLGGTHRLTVEVGSQRLVILSGEIVLLPVSSGNDVSITVTNGGSVKKFSLSGGEGGIYLDNRPRPLGLAPSSRESAAKVLAWKKSLTREDLVEEKS